MDFTDVPRQRVVALPTVKRSTDLVAHKDCADARHSIDALWKIVPIACERLQGKLPSVDMPHQTLGDEGRDWGFRATKSMLELATVARQYGRIAQGTARCLVAVDSH